MVKKIKLDFSKVEERSGYNTKAIPDGLHKMKVESVVEQEAGDGTDMLVYALVPADPKYKSRRFPYYCKLQQNQLWKLRDLIVATGGTVPKKATMIDPNGPVGKFLAAETEEETAGQYAGRSAVNNTYGLDILDEDGDSDASDEDDEDDEEYQGDEEEVDEEYEEEEDEDEEDEEEEDLNDLTLTELRKRAKGLGIDTTGLKKADLIDSILEEEGDDEDEDDLDDEELEDEDLDDEELYEDDEDEEEEEEPAPKRRAAPAKKPAAKAPAKKAPAPKAPAKRVVKRR